MRIAFLTNNTDITIGSYRIWVNDLCSYFNKIGIVSKINPPESQRHLFNIHIYAKNAIYSITYYPNIKIGCINPPCHNKKLLKSINFVIVGSWEERESMITYNKNCFIFPLIEKMFLNIPPKIHSNQKILTIGYHGNPNHLNHFHLGLQKALERFAKIVPIRLLVISKNNKEWIQGIPNIKIEYRKWNYSTIISNIQEFDIGIIPNISHFQTSFPEENLTLGIYHTDLQFRLKNKSNNGRLLVLTQLGIPAIADITPSNLHILGNPDNGYAVLTEEGWFQALLELRDSARRQFISQNASLESKRLYDPHIWSKKLINQLQKII